MTRPIPIALIKTLIEVIMLLACFSAMHINAIGQNRPSSYEGKEQMIVGHWKIAGVSIICNESIEVTQELNSPFNQSRILLSFEGLAIDLYSHNELLFNNVSPGKYRLTADSLFLGKMKIGYHHNEYDENLPSEEQVYRIDTTYDYRGFAIVQVDDSNLEVKYTIGQNDPEFNLRVKEISNDSAALEIKSLDIVMRFNRSRSPAARWSKLPFHPAIDSLDIYNLRYTGSSNRDLICIHNEILCFLNKAGYRNEQSDTLYFSKDRGKTWASRSLDFRRDTIDSFIDGYGIRRYSVMNEQVSQIFTSEIPIIIKTDRNSYALDSPECTEPIPIENQKILDCLINGLDTVLFNHAMESWKNQSQNDTLVSPTYAMSDSLYIYAYAKDCELNIFTFSAKSNAWKETTIKDKPFLPYRIAILDSVIIINGIGSVGMLLSFDNGKSWRPKLTSDIQWQNSLSPNLGTILKHGKYWLVGCDTGVWVSKDGGITWLNLNNKKLASGVNSIAVQGDELFALSYDGFLWKANLDELLRYAQED